MNLSKKQIDIIRSKTPKVLKGKQMTIYQTLGYFTPSYANWSYIAGYVYYKKNYVLVATRFGEIL